MGGVGPHTTQGKKPEKKPLWEKISGKTHINHLTALACTRYTCKLASLRIQEDSENPGYIKKCTSPSLLWLTKNSTHCCKRHKTTLTLRPGTPTNRQHLKIEYKIQSVIIAFLGWDLVTSLPNAKQTFPYAEQKSRLLHLYWGNPISFTLVKHFSLKQATNKMQHIKRGK